MKIIDIKSPIVDTVLTTLEAEDKEYRKLEAMVYI